MMLHFWIKEEAYEDAMQWEYLEKAKKALDDNKDKIPMELATAINEKIAAVDNKKGSDDAAGIKAATEDLSKEMSKVYEAMQKAASSEPERASRSCSRRS